MAEEGYDERLRRHQEMLEGLAKVWQRQGEINEEQREITMRLERQVERLDSYLARQDVLNERLILAIERLDATQADIAKLLARLLPPAGNGREA
jgi:hypothetical protein